jgi:hypothetical protein
MSFLASFTHHFIIWIDIIVVFWSYNIQSTSGINWARYCTLYLYEVDSSALCCRRRPQKNSIFLKFYRFWNLFSVDDFTHSYFLFLVNFVTHMVRDHLARTKCCFFDWLWDNFFTSHFLVCVTWVRSGSLKENLCFVMSLSREINSFFKPTLVSSF